MEKHQVILVKGLANIATARRTQALMENSLSWHQELGKGAI